MEGDTSPVIRENCPEQVTPTEDVKLSNSNTSITTNDAQGSYKMEAEHATEQVQTPSVTQDPTQPEEEIEIQTQAEPQAQENSTLPTEAEETQQVQQDAPQNVKSWYATPEKIEPIPPMERNRDKITSSNYVSAKRVDRSKSDIFSLNGESYSRDYIFSVTGMPSKGVLRQRHVTPAPAPSNIFPAQNAVNETSPPKDKMRDKNSYHQIKRPSSSMRNPLTGTGVISNDEYRFVKCEANRRKEGNPLLGVGYPEPPGSFSQNIC